MFDIVEFITRVFKKDKQEESRSRARERLKLVLVSDRSSMSPQMLESLREELIQVISKYMTIDINAMEIGLERNEGSVALAANIPIVNLGRVKKKTRHNGKQDSKTETPTCDEQAEEIAMEESSDISILQKPDTGELKQESKAEPCKKETESVEGTDETTGSEAADSSGQRKRSRRNSRKYKARTRGRSLRRKI
jgi:cell division topological specificity factor